MSNWAYTVNTAGVPTWAVPAMTPACPRSPASLYWGDSRIHGYPGNEPVPTPPPGVPPVDPRAPGIQPSHTAANHIYPSQYWNDITADWFYTPVNETGNNPAPIPAQALYYVGGLAAKRKIMFEKKTQ